MSDEVILARLVLINDHLIEHLTWAVENDKPDFAVKLAQSRRSFASTLEEMGLIKSKSLNIPERRQSSRKVAFE